MNSKLLDVSIFGFQASQVVLNSAGDIVQGDYIGFAADSISGAAVAGPSASGPNPGSDGLLILGANAIVGGVGAGQRNVISGNLGQGIEFQGSSATGGMVVNNYIGTNPSGTSALPNQINGILIGNGAGHEVIGPGNVISGNGDIGIELLDASGVVIIGNFIGTDASGTQALGNTGAGICVDAGSSSNTIGGMASGEMNLISGNQNGLVFQEASTQNTVAADWIGIDSNGAKALPNLFNGIVVFNGAGDETIGPGNIISGNTDIGIELFIASGVNIFGNFIGTDASGTQALPTARPGSASMTAPPPTRSGDGQRPDECDLGQRPDRHRHPGRLASEPRRIEPDRDRHDRHQGGRQRDRRGLRERVPGQRHRAGQPGLGQRDRHAGGGDLGRREGLDRDMVTGNMVGTDVTGEHPLGNAVIGVLINDAPRNVIGLSPFGMGTWSPATPRSGSCSPTAWRLRTSSRAT